MDFLSYQEVLKSRGNNLAQARRIQSDENINATFTSDPAYKRVYILTKNGWKFEDAKYQFHSTPSISKDPVDYYLQFRPKVHYPIGSYVFIPDDTNFEINLTEAELKEPFSLPEEKITQLWFLVGRDESLAYVRYNALKCNWNFKWLYKGQIYSCWGANRSANSYTSGIWSDEYSSSLDNLTSAWLPDTFYVYGDKLKELGLYDNRTIMHKQRFMLSNNALDPKVYQVTKIVDLSPSGVIKLSIKQDELNLTCDNLELQICDYYSSEGDSNLNVPEEFNTSKYNTSEIYKGIIDENNELILDPFNSLIRIPIGKTFYFLSKFSDDTIKGKWFVSLEDEEHIYSEKDKKYYEGLLSLTDFNDNVLAIKPGKAKSLIGKKFKLCTCDDYGDYYSSIILEVVS